MIIVSSSSDENPSSPSNFSSSNSSLPTTGVLASMKKSMNLTSPAAVDVKKIPFDIDGNVVYKLPYDSERKMKSSLDGRPWKTCMGNLF